MYYIVFDLEWNQSPDGKSASVEHFPFEIIEIGAVRLDEQFHQVDQFHRLIRPQVYKEIHFRITEVTHMDMGELQQDGEDFVKAAEDFFSWCGLDAVFCTWGSMDLAELQRNMDYYGIAIPMGKPLLYYDVQKLYCLSYGDGKQKQSLDQAVEELGIDQIFPFHRALEDAYYTGRVFEKLDFEEVRDYYSVDYYRIPYQKEEEIYLTFPSYSKFVSRAFETREQAIADRNVADMRCYRCKRMLRKKIHWFTTNQKIYLGLACCPEHGFLKGKIRIKKSEDGQFFAVKTLKLVDEADANQLRERREEFCKRRNRKNKNLYRTVT